MSTKLTIPKQAIIKQPSLTYRRLWLDHLLTYFSPEIKGYVLDVGGKRENKRGAFRPEKTQATKWHYLNIERITQPDIYADVEAIPIKNATYDTVICTEVLEHLRAPATCVSELTRILHPNGVAFASIPFLYPVHSDPFDFQRFTADGLLQLFNRFSSIEIIPMGGYLGVMGAFLDIGADYVKSQKISHKLLRRSMKLIARSLYISELSSNAQPKGWQNFTTGYFLKAQK